MSELKSKLELELKAIDEIYNKAKESGDLVKLEEYFQFFEKMHEEFIKKYPVPQGWVWLGFMDSRFHIHPIDNESDD